MSFLHPEWVNGRRIWMDGPMHDLIHRIQYGDPVKGWEGDSRLALYFNGEDERFELWRLEDDETYRMVARSDVGVALDERIIDALIAMDGRRRNQSLADEVLGHNAVIQTERDHQRDEWVAEDMAPRLRHAFTEEL
jgi:hypothetical protein